jgi:hypothetical protein
MGVLCAASRIESETIVIIHGFEIMDMLAILFGDNDSPIRKEKRVPMGAIPERPLRVSVKNVGVHADLRISVQKTFFDNLRSVLRDYGLDAIA